LLAGLVKAVPALISIFWGAPLVAREMETGTFRLAWTQSVTRARWLVTKLAMLGLASVALTGLLTLVVAWWANPLDRANTNRFLTFDQRGLAPLGYAAAAFAIGVTFGVLIRRTLPAMATALGTFFFVRFGVTYWVRPNLFPAIHLSSSLTSGEGLGFLQTPAGVSFVAGRSHIPNALVMSNHIVDATGHVASPEALHSYLVQACPQLVANLAAPQQADHTRVGQKGVELFHDCVQKLSAKYHLITTYQPPHRYWPLQWSETGIFLALAIALSGLCIWWVRRRLT
jgi:hypothetical protein